MSRSRCDNPRLFGHITSGEAGTLVDGATLIWPVGAIEQHGPHLPLSVDMDLATAFGAELTQVLGGYLLPTLPIGARSLPCSGGGLSFPGTLYVTGPTLTHYLAEAVRSLTALKPGRLIILNGHYENESHLFESLELVRSSQAFGDVEVLAFSWWSFVEDKWFVDNAVHFPGWHAEHASLTETCLMMFLHPDLVRATRPAHDSPPRAGLYHHPVDAARISNEGVLSSTTGATAALGESLFWHVVDNVMAYIQDESVSMNVTPF